MITPLTRNWKTRCTVCGQTFENGVGSTPCCGALQKIIEHGEEALTRHQAQDGGNEVANECPFCLSQSAKVKAECQHCTPKAINGWRCAGPDTWVSPENVLWSKAAARKIQSLEECLEACRRIARDAKEFGGLEVTVGALEDAINAAKKFEI